MTTHTTHTTHTTDFFEGKSLGELLAEGLEEFSDALRTDKSSIPEKFTCHKVALDLVPTLYNAELVKKTRETLCASQTVFARFLGVSVKSIRSWEQGINVPRDAACRLMDEIRHDPAYWKARMRELIVKKATRPKKSKA